MTLDSVSIIRIWICKNFDKQFTLQDLSNEFGYSPEHIHREFFRIYGITPKELQVEQRFRVAHSHIVLGHPVNKCCVTVGFESTTTFSRWFRRRSGRSPRELVSCVRRAQSVGIPVHPLPIPLCLSGQLKKNIKNG